MKSVIIYTLTLVAIFGLNSISERLYKIGKDSDSTVLGLLGVLGCALSVATISKFILNNL